MLKFLCLFITSTCFLFADNDLQAIRTSVLDYRFLKSTELEFTARDIGYQNPELRYLHGKIDASHEILELINQIELRRN